MAHVRGAGGTREVRKQLFILLHSQTMKQISLFELLGNERSKMPVLISTSFRNRVRKGAGYVTGRDTQEEGRKEKLQNPPGGRQHVQDCLNMLCLGRDWMREGRMRKKILSYSTF